MSNLEIDVEAKLAQLSELKNELDKLDENFDRLMKTVGVTKEDLRKFSAGQQPPENK
ncbi:MAG: hypothetical protein LBE31_07745 [Deltaproteobacteria bacterium]|jgi:archaellum component FlaC|nr:hypothetical protein [Deltaproteobacteria bacterium]